MKMHHALVSASALLASVPIGIMSAHAQDQSATAQGNASPMAMVLVPTELAQNDIPMEQGCWARVYKDTNYRGHHVTIVGPTSVADVDKQMPFRVDWASNAGSIVVGPNARVTTYGDKAFDKQLQQYQPSAKVADMSQGEGTGNFSSLNIACQQPGQEGNWQGTKSTAANQAPVVMMLVPVQLGDNDIAMKRGCWARLYDGQNYSGDMLTLVGPADVPDIEKQTPYSFNWEDKVSSLQVGPNATLMVYDNDNFADPVGSFKGGTNLADVSRRLGFFDEFASLKIACS